MLKAYHKINAVTICLAGSTSFVVYYDTNPHPQNPK